MGAVVAFIPPLALGAVLLLGLGSAVARLSGRELPLGAIPAVGLSTLIVLGQFATLVHLPGLMAALGAAAIAAVGLLAGGLGRLAAASRIAIAACATVVVVCVGVIAATGQATFGGYTQLADTAIHLLGATYLPGGAPSDLGGAAGAAWRGYYDAGYPTGGATALGVLSAAASTAPLHALQPLIALAMGTITASVWTLLSDALPERRRRGAIAMLAAFPGLLFGFAMQGSLKEVLAAALIVGVAAALPQPPQVGAPWTWRSVIPASVGVAALAATVGGAAVIYVAPVAAIAILPWARVAGRRRAITAALGVGGLATVLSVPTLLALDGYLKVSGAVLTAQAERGNLAGALLPKRELSGIWLGPDFRTAPLLPTWSSLLGTVMLLAAAGGLLLVALARWRSPGGRAGALAGWMLGGGVSLLLVERVGSPWADWKAYAIFTPIVITAAGLGLATLAHRPRLALPAGGLAAVLGLGIAGTVGMTAHAVPVAPADRFAELARIDERFAGRGPMFTAEFEEFDRALLPRTATTFAGDSFDGVPGTFSPPISGDTDGLDVTALARFPLLLVRSGPQASRPPGNYVRRWQGRWYEVWARDPSRAASARRLPLGAAGGAGAAVPRCSAVRELAASATGDQVLRAASAPARQVMPVYRRMPEGWDIDGTARTLPNGAARFATTFTVAPRTLVDVWFSGRDPLPLQVRAGFAGATIGPATFGPAGSATFVSAARADERGRLLVLIDRPARPLLPGSGDRYARWVSVSITTHDPRGSATIRTVDPSDRAAVTALCRQRLDWIELAAR